MRIRVHARAMGRKESDLVRGLEETLKSATRVREWLDSVHNMFCEIELGITSVLNLEPDSDSKPTNKARM